MIYMGNHELKYRYKDGASLQILAELNACSQKEVYKKIKKEDPAVRVSKREKEELEFHTLHAQGKTDSQIAKKMDVSQSRVALWRQINCLPSNGKDSEETDDRLANYLAGMTDKEMAEAEGLAERTMRSWRLDRGLAVNRPKQREYDERKQMIDAGLTDKQIAEAQGLKENTVKRWRAKYEMESKEEE